MLVGEGGVAALDAELLLRLRLLLGLLCSAPSSDPGPSLLTPEAIEFLMDECSPASPKIGKLERGV